MLLTQMINIPVMKLSIPEADTGGSDGGICYRLAGGYGLGDTTYWKCSLANFSAVNREKFLR